MTPHDVLAVANIATAGVFTAAWVLERLSFPLQMFLSSPCVSRLVHGPAQRLNGFGGQGW